MPWAARREAVRRGGGLSGCLAVPRSFHGRAIAPPADLPERQGGAAVFTERSDMSFDDDVRDADFRRAPLTIEITTFDGEPVETIDVPELTIPAEDLPPRWRAAEEKR